MKVAAKTIRQDTTKYTLFRKTHRRQKKLNKRIRSTQPVVAENALEKVKIKLHEDTQFDQIILIVVLGGLAASACTYAASISRRD